MSRLGIGVMISRLGGNEESVRVFKEAVGKEIAALNLDEDALRFTFSDGSGMALYDDGQSCCENRYMTTDDELSGFVGEKLLDAEIKEAPSMETEYDEHERAFLEVKTSGGSFTVETHNEHNGYYGGFEIRARKEI